MKVLVVSRSISINLLCFSATTPPHDVRLELAGNLNINHVGTQDKYLELPSIVQKSKKITFGAVKDKVQKRVEGWKGKLISSGRRHVLIKSVGDAILIYTLACFKLPDILIQEIYDNLAKFWWGQQRNERKIAWMSWD
ncbi:putative mitochondrial protein [Arachis hypogaea]|nr:putative mitochondrial protein [Arachis hypogaea]